MDKRDIGSEILDGLKAIKQGKGTRKVVKIPDVVAIRKSMNANQDIFATMLGVSERTVQDWEQGRRNPSDPAATHCRSSPGCYP